MKRILKGIICIAAIIFIAGCDYELVKKQPKKTASNEKDATTAFKKAEMEKEYKQLCEKKRYLLETSSLIMKQEREIRETQEKMAEELRTIDHEIREAGKKYTDSCSFEDIQSGKYHTAKAQYDALVNGKPKIAIAQQEVIRELQNGVERQKMSYNNDVDTLNTQIQNYFIRYGSAARADGLEPLTRH